MLETLESGVVLKGRTLYPTEPRALPDKFLTFQPATPESVLFFRRYSLRMKVLSEGFSQATTAIRREKPLIRIYRVFPAILHVFRFCTTYPQLRSLLF